MSINEAQRRQVFSDLERALGTESAAIVMERVFAPIEWSDVARQSAMEARFSLVDAQFVAVRGEMAELRAELTGEMAELRAEVHGSARRLAAINAISVVAASMSTAALVLAAGRFT